MAVRAKRAILHVHVSLTAESKSNGKQVEETGAQEGDSVTQQLISETVPADEGTWQPSGIVKVK